MNNSLAIAYNTKRRNMKAKGGLIENESLHPMNEPEQGVKDKVLHQMDFGSRAQSHDVLPLPEEPKFSRSPDEVNMGRNVGVTDPEDQPVKNMRTWKEPSLIAKSIRMAKGGMAESAQMCAHGGPAECAMGCYAKGGEAEAMDDSDWDNFLSDDEDGSEKGMHSEGMPEGEQERMSEVGKKKRILSSVMEKMRLRP